MLMSISKTAWRKLLKDLITYFREIQTQYDNRAKSMLKISNVINNTTSPSMFLSSGGLDDALQILRGYHKIAIAEANKSKEIENDVILALAGLRSDLNLKIKEIKNLSGDFKNSVEKEMESTRRVVNNLQEGLGQADIDPAQMTGRQDPYLLRLAADRQVEKQIDEENYLHQVSNPPLYFCCNAERCRRISTLKHLVGNWRLLSWAKFKNLTMQLPASSSGRRTRLIAQSTSYVLGQLLCQRITNGIPSSRTTSISLILAFQSARPRTSSIQDAIMN